MMMKFAFTNHKLVDGVFLLKIENVLTTSLIAMSPGIEGLEQDIKEFEFLTPTTKSKIDNTCLYVYNGANDAFYYVLVFFYENETYELVIKSYQRCVTLYLQFLKDLIASFVMEEKSMVGYNPDNVFIAAQSILNGWPTKIEEKMILTFLSDSRIIELTSEDFAYNDYHPTAFFDKNDFEDMFFDMISNKPILIVVPDALYGCRSCFSLFALLNPVQYREKFILWLRNDDPRYQQIVEAEGKSPYFVVATDDPSKIEDKFDRVIVCDQMIPPNTKVEEAFLTAIGRNFKLIQSEFDSLRNQNPYSDLLNVPWMDDNLEAFILSNPQYKWIPDFEILRAFEKTKTIKQWRLQRCRPSLIRNTLIQSGNFKFNGMTKKELNKILKYINDAIPEFEGDIHVVAILKKHSAEIKKLLSQNQD